MPELLTSPQYLRAPITEAVIQIAVSADADQRALEKIAHRLKPHYPHSQPEQLMTIAPNNNQVRISQSPQGYRLANDDQTDIVILGPRGVTAARLPPYPGWNYLRDRANAAWQEWKRETARHPIERLGVRYINRIDVPVDAVVPFRVQDYLTFYPTVTPITDKDPVGYLVQVVIPTLSPKWNATLTTTTLGANEVPQHVSLILDIDVMRTVDIPLNDTQLWPTIDEAQALKNDIFERCITPTARKLFQS